MKIGLRLGSLVIMLGLLAGGYAQSVVGSWRGQFVIDKSTLPKGTPQQQAQIQQRLVAMDAMLKRAKLSLVFKAKTFVMSGSDIPGMAGSQVSEGVYSRSGGTLTLISKKDNGKPPVGRAAQPQKMAIGQGGKSLILLVPNPGQVKVSIMFTRG